MTTHDGRVTTVVVSRNRREQLLHSLGRHEPPVILVDNGSTDGTVEAVRERHPHVEVVALERNHGSPGRNVGVRRARTDYVAFADDDSWWAQGALARAADVFDSHPRLGLLAARVLVGPEERLDPFCDEVAASPLEPFPDTPGTPILGFMACGAVVRRDAFVQSGGFDEVTFFLGEEDRLAWDMAGNGWGLAYLPEIVAHHHPQQGTGRGSRGRLVVRNALLTAVMRRPWRVVVSQALQALRSGRHGVGGVVDAVPRMPAALSCRSRLPDSVEARVRALQG